MSFSFKLYPSELGKSIKLPVILFISFFALMIVSPMVLVAQPTDCATQTQIPQTECEALIALYNTTDGPNWSNNTDLEQQ